MKFSRRDLLIGSAGVGAGLVFSPVPWKLLGDVSIWTQNWPWIPQPARGPVETKQSVCTLCGGGCGIRVRMAAGWPVGISGVATDPVTKGALCPLAFAAQQLNWHPRRLREVRHHGRAATWQDARAAFEKACAEGPVAIVDARPGRAVSAILQDFAAKRNGNYQVALGPESRALAPYAEWSGVPIGALGYDLENTRTLVSFGAPLLDGWGTPGRFTRLWSERAAGQADPQLRLIQIEPALSRTGARAWSWVAIREGSDAALAAGLAHVLVEERLVAAKSPVPQMSLQDAAAQSGLSVDAIRELARTIVANRPVLVIAPDTNPSIACLNLLLGSVGAPGGIAARSKFATARKAPATGTVRAMLVDATVPWDYAPQTNAEVFRLAAWEGGASWADWLLPAPGFLEELTDVPTSPTSGLETYAIAANLLKPAEGIKTAAQFLAEIDATLPDTDKLIQARCEQIFKERAGTVFGEKAAPVTSFESAQKLEEELKKGAVWVGEPARAIEVKCVLKDWPAATQKTATKDWAASWAPPVFPALVTKLYQESQLRATPGRRVA